MPERKTRVAILLKQDLFGAISIDAGIPCTDGSELHAVGSSDPRCKTQPRFLRSFESRPAAENAFHAALAASRDRGWTVAHIGERNNG